MSADLAALRREYRRHALRAEAVAASPIEQFETWFAEARRAEVPEANAMTLATATADGRPSARVVLLKAVDARGFVFYTNHRSRKARELEENPQAALTFWWQPLERQVRIEGRAERVAPETADAYFRSRPRESRLGAHASPQSEPVKGRGVLEERLAAAEARYEGREVPRPAHWGGYRVVPEAVEFWQGRPGRLHDRLRYRRTAGDVGDDGGADGWTLERLAP